MVHVSESHLLHIKADLEERKKALKKRKRIEAKFTEAKKHHQMARARYQGRLVAVLQLFNIVDKTGQLTDSRFLLFPGCDC